MESYSKVRRVMDKHVEAIKHYRGYSLQSELNLLRYDRKVQLCASLIPKHARVLDIGCGDGHTTVALKLARPDIKIEGLSLQKSRMWDDFARKFKITFTKGNALKSPFKNNEFDAVVSFGVMEHVSNDRKFLQEVHRILKPHGLNIIMHLPNLLSVSELISKVLELHGHARRYRLREVRQMLHDAGFTDIRIWRENIIPAQMARISRKLNDFWNQHYKALDKLDSILIRTPFRIFSHDYLIVCRKG